MAERRIGSTQIHQDAASLIVYCPALRSAAPALMLALFGTACSFIALASLTGLVGHGGDGSSNLLALAFAGVFVLPLISIGTVFIAIALWTALNALTVAATQTELRADRRWCGIPLAQKIVAVETIHALDVLRDARFLGFFGGVRYYRLLARTTNSSLLLADHLRGADEVDAVKQLFVSALGRPALSENGRCEHIETTEAAAAADDAR
jgi:hypothetical protein